MCKQQLEVEDSHLHKRRFWHFHRVPDVCVCLFGLDACVDDLYGNGWMDGQY